MTEQNQIDEAIASVQALFNTPESISFAKRMDFEDYLNDAYPIVTIEGQVFFPSDILREIDPIGFCISQREYESNTKNKNE